MEPQSDPIPEKLPEVKSGNGNSYTVLIAEDDEDDFLLIEEAFKEADLMYGLHWVKDGEELVNYLFALIHQDGSGNYVEPALIILDLNMPKVSGFEALAQIKAHPRLRKIPVVILTTSQSEDDVLQGYDIGVNSFIQKPIRFESLVEVIQTLDQYWFNIVKLPKP
ncbi:MAG: response regulator [Nitrospinales bacterium]